MRTTTLFAVTAIVAGLCDLQTSAQSNAQLISREVLFAGPDRANPLISPDGTKISYLAPVNGIMNVWVGPIDDPAAAVPVPMCGHVTSSYASACLGHPFAMALVAGGHSRIDQTVYAALLDGNFVPMKITSPVFYDAKGERQNV